MDLRLIVEGLDNANTEIAKLSPTLSPVSPNTDLDSRNEIGPAMPNSTCNATMLNISQGTVTQLPEKQQPEINCEPANSLPDRYSHPKHSNPPQVARSTKSKFIKTMKQPLAMQPHIVSSQLQLPAPNTQQQPQQFAAGTAQLNLPVHVPVQQPAPVPQEQYNYSNGAQAPFFQISNPQFAGNGLSGDYYGKYPSPPQAQPQLHLCPIGYTVKNGVLVPLQGCIIDSSQLVDPQFAGSQQQQRPSHPGIPPPIAVHQLPVNGPQLMYPLTPGGPTFFSQAPMVQKAELSSPKNGSSVSPPSPIKVKPEIHQIPPPVLPISNANENHFPTSTSYSVASSVATGSSTSASTTPASSPLEKQDEFEHQKQKQLQIQQQQPCQQAQSSQQQQLQQQQPQQQLQLQQQQPQQQQLQLQQQQQPNGTRFWRFVDESKRESSKPAVSASSLKEYIQIVDAESGEKLDNNTQWASKRLKYGCKECGRMFFRKSDLVRHIQIHLGIKPNHCHICGKQFIQRSALTVHLRVHTGEKPFGCAKCGRTFSDSSSLARHRRIHLRNEGLDRVKDAKNGQAPPAQVQALPAIEDKAS